MDNNVINITEKNICYELGHKICRMITDLIRHTPVNTIDVNCSKSVFAVSDISKIIIFEDYMHRYIKYVDISICELIVAIVLLDRFIKEYYEKTQKNCNIKIMIHKLFAISLILSQKLCSDKFDSLKYLSLVVGMPITECVKCEIEFLSFINNDLYVSPDTYKIYTTIVNKII